MRERSAVRSFERTSLLLSIRLGISESGADVGEVSPCNDDDATGARLDERANAVEKSRDAAVLLRVDSTRLRRAEPRKHRDDSKLAALEDVFQEDDLELEGVFALVVELVGVRGEAVCGGGEGVEAGGVGPDGAEGGVERRSAKGEGLSHGGVRGAEDDEGVDT